jgi:hypothetical protein
MLFDTPSLSYLTPTLFGPKSSYLPPTHVLFDSLSLSYLPPTLFGSKSFYLARRLHQLYHFLPTPILLVPFYVECYFV